VLYKPGEAAQSTPPDDGRNKDLMGGREEKREMCGARVPHESPPMKPEEGSLPALNG